MSDRMEGKGRNVKSGKLKGKSGKLGKGKSGKLKGKSGKLGKEKKWKAGKGKR
jgi:hypothetical protein